MLKRRSLLNLGKQLFLAAGLSLAPFAGLASQTNLVVNGDFENGSYAYGSGTLSTVPNGWVLGPPGSPGPSNMKVESGTGPLPNQGPESGSYYMTFQSPATSGRDCLYQDLTTVAGRTYTVSFYVAIAPGTLGATPPGLDVVWDENRANSANLGTTAPYYAPSNTFSSPYQFYSFTATASASTTRIDFHAIDATGAIFLDNVSVTTFIPSLYIAHSGNKVTVSWQNVAGWNLQQTTNLAAPANWTYSTGVTNNAGTNYLTLTNTIGSRLFRLSNP